MSKELDLEECHRLFEFHEKACENEEHFLEHPKQPGILIMTAYCLSTTQKHCCGKKCFFCPHKHQNVGRNHKCTEATCPFQVLQ